MKILTKILRQEINGQGSQQKLLKKIPNKINLDDKLIAEDRTREILSRNE